MVGRLASCILLGLIRGYQLIVSPVLGGNCRYQPTCSEYARDAIARYGVLRGGLLALRRVGRCHPWGGYGYDPVPERSEAGKEGADDADARPHSHP
ncbi:MAG: membrane protein insertion efficiency factor YidD [Gammaproteobacteria bacterium]